MASRARDCLWPPRRWGRGAGTSTTDGAETTREDTRTQTRAVAGGQRAAAAGGGRADPVCLRRDEGGAAEQVHENRRVGRDRWYHLPRFLRLALLRRRLLEVVRREQVQVPTIQEGPVGREQERAACAITALSFSLAQGYAAMWQDQQPAGSDHSGKRGGGGAGGGAGGDTPGDGKGALGV